MRFLKIKNKSNKKNYAIMNANAGRKINVDIIFTIQNYLKLQINSTEQLKRLNKIFLFLQVETDSNITILWWKVKKNGLMQANHIEICFNLYMNQNVLSHIT